MYINWLKILYKYMVFLFKVPYNNVLKAVAELKKTYINTILLELFTLAMTKYKYVMQIKI